MKNAIYPTSLKSAESFRFGDADIFEKDKKGKDILPEKLIEHGRSREYWECAVCIAGSILKYRAAADGPDGVTQEQFESDVNRITGNLFKKVYSLEIVL